MLQGMAIDTRGTENDQYYACSNVLWFVLKPPLTFLLLHEVKNLLQAACRLILCNIPLWVQYIRSNELFIT